MPRNKPTEFVDRIGEIDMEPLNAVAEYLTSKKYNKIFLKPPAYNSTGDGPEQIYLNEKIQHQNVMKQQLVHREDRRMQGIILRHRMNKIAKDVQFLRATFININNIIRDLDERTKFSLKKIAEEKEKQKKMIVEYGDKSKKYDALKQFKRTFKQCNNEYESYERVLKDAAKISGYGSISALVSRCDAMIAAQAEITEMNTKLIASILKMRKKMLSIIKNTESVYVGLKNELDRMNLYYRMACQECLRWERIFAKITDAVIEVNLKKGMARQTIHHLYVLMCRRKGVAPIYRRAQVEACLRFVASEVMLLQDILKEVNNPKKQDKKDICSNVKWK